MNILENIEIIALGFGNSWFANMLSDFSIIILANTQTIYPKTFIGDTWFVYFPVLESQICAFAPFSILFDVTLISSVEQGLHTFKILQKTNVWLK